MLSNILMGFSTAFNPMNLLLLMGGNCFRNFIWSTSGRIIYNGCGGADSSYLWNGCGKWIDHAGRYLLWFNIWRQYFCMSA